MRKLVVFAVKTLLLSLARVPTAELQPAFTAVPPNPFTVLESDNITLEWYYDLAGESFVRVEFVDVTSSPAIRILEVNTVGQPPKRLNENYIGRVQVNVTATHTSITIFGANRTVDSKEYEFEVVPQSSNVVPSLVRISVQYPPEFTNVSDDQEAVEGGSSITLQCIAIGEPPPNITWTRVLDSSSDSNVLFTGEQLVLDNNRNYTGTYRCTAYNGIGTAPNRTIAVDVTYKPENVNLTVNDSSICKGDIISITCSADGKPDVDTYQLFENDKPVPDGDTTGVWKRTMSVQGIFTYRCVANNSAGTSDKNVTVTVNVPAVVYQLENITVTEGENSTLTCNVSGSPTPSVTWTEVKTGNRSMGIIREFTRINRNQSGEYMCEASNFCGNDRAKTFVTVQYKPENFQFAASEIEVCEDEVINFTCSADGNPAVYTYQLFENNAPVTDGSNSHGMWNRTMSRGGVFIYKCVANNTAGTGQSETLTVTVNVPSAIQPIQNVNITEGGNLTLLCNVSGIPSPMVSWIKVEGDMVTDKNELVFTNVNRSQAGEYRCKASNQCGNRSETATIEVHYPPDNVQLETSAADNRACRGDIINITCSAEAVPSVTSYQLFENDTAIFDTSGMWTRNFTTEGTFIYKCMANNSLGTGQSESVTVTVNVASSIQPIEKQPVMEGHNLTVVCNASGIPPPMVTWIKVDGGEPFDGKELVFTHINRSQAGEYMCVASNECGNASVTATIEVQFKPDNLQLETSADDNKACRGDVISINCSAVAVPSEISYQLLENEVGILDASGRWDRPLTTAGMFTYKCVPNNTLGTGENATVTVTVNVPSSIQPIQNKTMIEEGENVTVPCNASGTSPLMVSWIKVDGGKRFDGSELMFTHINRSEAGEYRCEATNECGNASENTTIEVQYKPENVQLKTSAIDSKACKDETISINCSAVAVPFVTSYELFENDSIIMDTSGMWSRTFSSGGVFVYKCVANNSLGSMESESVTVTVNVPSAIEPIHNKNITEGGSITLSCSATGTPPPMVSWIKVDSHMRFNESDLVFTNINRSEAGEYRCEANNECGNASETATIEVQYQPENVQLKTSVIDGKTCKEETISINCSADAVPSVTSYELFENDSVIMDTSGMWSRTLSSGGVFVYKCVANNSLGSTESESVTVTVNVPSSIYPIQDKTITEGGSVTLSCNASGMPPPMVSWIKVDDHTGTNLSELEFRNINRNEAGEYKCEASNECGNASKTAKIFVQYMPEITSISDNQTLNKGDSTSLNCTANGYPTPNTTWTKVSDNSSVSFPLMITGKQNEGLYRCTADNGIGSPATDEVFITVHLPSSIEPFKNKTNVERGEDVTLHCNVSGTPAPRVSWTRVKTGEKWFNKTKVIVYVKVDDLGEYKCEASNPYGNASKSIFIFFPGGLCEVECLSGKSCRRFGQFVCLCIQGKKGTDCAEDDVLKKTFEVGIKFKDDFKPEYEDLENAETKLFVKNVMDAVKMEFNGSGVKDVKVTKLRKGSVIADMEVTFNEEVGASEVDALLSQAAKDGKIGDLEVGEIQFDGLIKDFSTPAPSEPAEVNRDVIYGTVIGILVLMLTVFIIYVILKHRQRQGDNRLNITAAVEGGPQLNEGMEIDGSNENVSNTNHHAASQYMPLVEVTPSSGGTGPEISPYSEINEYAPLHPGTRSWEVPRESIVLEKIIGKGAFGQVAQGEASQLRGRDGRITVAIKMLKDNPTEKERKDLLSELEVLKKLKPHRHVIKLLGCVTQSDPLLVIIEYVPYGDLLGYLRKSRGLNDTYFKDPDVRPQTSLTSQQLIKFSWQVADGMRYLSSRNIIHRDLAARNVLVGEQETCKVTDFGMARDVNQENIYETKTKNRLPVKWTAYEALLFGRYTTKSDVWSFGIVLYEIFTIGGSPYPRTNPRKMADILNRGYRMPKPSHVDEALYKIMQDCWQEDPNDRPTFENLRDELKEMENQHQRLINLKDYDKKLYENVEDLMF